MEFRLASKDKPIIIVKAEVNGSEPLDFALDTGASATVISTQTAEKLGVNVKALPKEKECCGCSGGRMEARLGSVKSIRVGDAEARDVDVAIMDLTNISRAVGTELAGIIGYTFMKDYRVVVDYPNKRIFFERSQRNQLLKRLTLFSFFNKV